MQDESNRTAAWALVEVRPGAFVVMLTKTARHGPKGWRLVSSHRYRDAADRARDRIEAAVPA